MSQSSGVVFPSFGVDPASSCPVSSPVCVPRFPQTKDLVPEAGSKSFLETFSFRVAVVSSATLPESLSAASPVSAGVMQAPSNRQALSAIPQNLCILPSPHLYVHSFPLYSLVPFTPYLIIQAYYCQNDFSSIQIFPCQTLHPALFVKLHCNIKSPVCFFNFFYDAFSGF